MEEETKKIVKIYTSPTCHYCHLAKDFMKEKGIEFEEIDVSKDRASLEDMVKKTGHMGVPVIEGINGEIIIGFDQDALEKLAK